LKIAAIETGCKNMGTKIMNVEEEGAEEHIWRDEIKWNNLFGRG
jgi:hypothetical protein